MRRTLIISAFLLSAVFAPFGAAAAAEPEVEDAGQLLSFRHGAMGTFFELQFYPPRPGMLAEDARPIAQEVFDYIDALENRISNWKRDSIISRVNREAHRRPVAVSADIMELLRISGDIHEATGGAFDVTVGPLLELWGFYRKAGTLPNPDQLEEALEKVGFEKLAIDVDEDTVGFAQRGMNIDFGGIGKGYAVDVAAQMLKRHGVTRALVHSGTSSALAVGAPPGREGWTVRLEQAYNTDTTYTEEVLIRDGEAFSTSSAAEKFFKLEGKTYGHIFDPRTGMPAQGVLTAMVVAPDATLADALSTSFFVMGPDGVAEYCAQHPEVRAILLLMDEQGNVESKRFNFD